MEEMYNVVIAKPDGSINICQIPATLKGMQEAVGGYIELFMTTPSGLDFFCNEDGIALGLMPTRFWGGGVILGNILVTSHDEEGNTLSLNPDQIAEAVARLAFPYLR